MKARLHPLVPAMMVFTLACTDPIEPETDLPVVLAEQAPGMTVLQNDPSIGCPAHPHRGYGFQLTLAWSAVTDASAIEHYELWVQHEGSPYPMLNVSTDRPGYSFRACNSFVIDRNLTDWRWKVRAVTRDGARGAWSEREFSFEPCRLASGAPCQAPAPTST